MSGRSQARAAFETARAQERALHGAAELHRQAHGRYPDEYLSAQQATTAAWERYLDTAPAHAAAEPEPEAG